MRQRLGARFCRCLRPPMGGSGAKLTAKDGEDFRAAMKEHGIERAYIHAPYYINLASGKAGALELGAYYS